jgi:2-iminobutanoate/2-iminopropanoate deaminase
MKTIIDSDNAPKPIGPYNQAIRVNNFLFISGQLAFDQKQGKIVTQDITQQTKQVIENLKAILQSAGYTLTDIVQTNVYLSSMMLFKEFNIEYAKYFQEKSPARVTVAVELPLNALVEISAIAHKD